MLELISVLCWLLLALLSVRVLAVLLRPPSPHAGLPMPPAAVSGTAAADLRRGAARGAPVAAVNSATAEWEVPSPPVAPSGEVTGDRPVLLPPSPPAARSGILLLGADDGDLATARAAAARHLTWLSHEPLVAAAPRTAGSGHAAVDLGANRVAVLGPGATADAALADSAAAGVPLLLPARTRRAS